MAQYEITILWNKIRLNQFGPGGSGLDQFEPGGSGLDQFGPRGTGHPEQSPLNQS